nr:MAG TPA: hypothetical protein [Caudoviricetes sp.]
MPIQREQNQSEETRALHHSQYRLFGWTKQNPGNSKPA